MSEEVKNKSEYLVEVRDLKQYFPIKTGFMKTTPLKAVDGVSFSIKPGETLGLVGESGCGKTTVGRSLLRLYTPTSGDVFFDGERVDEKSIGHMRRQMQMVFQDPYSSLNPRMTVGQIIAEPLRHEPGLTPAQKRQRVTDTLVDVGLPEQFRERFAHQLSGGQRQRVAIGRALVRRPRLVIADEPISALDMTIQKQILELFERLQRQYGFACLFISHDLSAVERIAHRVAVMNQGEVVEIGSRDSIFDTPQHPYTRRLLAAASPLEKRADGSYRLRASVI